MIYSDCYDYLQHKRNDIIEDKKLRDQLIKKAYKKTSENFTWEKIIEKYNNIYHKLFIN